MLARSSGSVMKIVIQETGTISRKETDNNIIISDCRQLTSPIG